MSSDPALALVLATGFLCAGAVGAYLGIARARAPFNAPESSQVIDRRGRFKQEHLRQVRVAVVVTALLFLAAVVYLIASQT